MEGGVMKTAIARWASMLVLCLAAAAPSQAGVVIEGTRVVYPGAEREVNVRMTNKRDYPVLVEAWLERGQAASDEHTPPPFVITPPLFRLDPAKGQTLRIFQLPAAAQLPTDRESLFWLSVKDIPPETNTAENQLKIAYRSRLKFFYRPASLRLDPYKALEQLKWTLDRADGALVVHNPTPYHITLTGVRVPQGVEVAGEMVAPFDTLRLSIPDGAVAGAPLEYTVVNDYGARITLNGRFDDTR
jgi:chaperone protein EcpD